MPISIDSPKLRNDDQYVAHLVRHSKSRRGKILSGDKYFAPQTVGLVWLNPSDRVFSLNGSQLASTALTWTNIFDKGSIWTINFSVSSYVTGNIVFSNSESTSAAITANGDHSIELTNYEDLDLLLTADALFNGVVTISTIKRLS